MMIILAFVIVTLIALVEALLFWLCEILKLRLFLKRKIDGATYTFPLAGLIFALLTWVPAELALTLVSDDHKTMYLIALLAVPGFFMWASILKKPMDSWRLRIVKKLTPERTQELADTTAIADYLNSGGPN